MKLFKAVFSPTGGTKKVADMISAAISDVCEEIDLSDSKTDFGRYHLKKEDVCLIAVPSFGGRVPQTALQRLLAVSGGGARAVIVAVYGNRHYDDTLIELKEAAKEAGFLPVAAAAAVAAHSIMPQFGQGRPDESDIKELTEFGNKIRTSWEFLNAEVNVPGNYPYKAYGGVQLKPKAGKRCSGCGLCAEKCPTDAVSRENPELTDEKKCISCMRCINICPNGARSLDKAMVEATVAKLQKACETRKKNEFFYSTHA